MAKVKPLSIENARIGFRNFEGRESQYNKAGDRSFAVFLDRAVAEELAAEGWNVKFPKDDPRAVDPDADGRDPHLTISVSFDNYPPNMFIIANGKPSRLTEEEVLMLDWAELEMVDLVIRPYEWSVNRNSGIKAYLKAGYFTIVTDQFQAKYGL
jgi:hypothetical protein